MVQTKITRATLLAGGAAALLLGTLRSRVGARSEFLEGDGFRYAAFDRLPITNLPVGPATIRVGFAPGTLALPRETILDWAGRSARAVAGYYGRFPVDTARLLFVPVAGSGVQGGTTWGYRGGAIRILLGQEARDAALARDWMLVHEMVHLALPQLDQEHGWLSEGIAVYVEPVARVLAGDLPAERIWADMARDMRQGLPRGGQGGLEGTTEWSRIYWGGALFCLKADVGIRRKTNNRLGLRDALRGILAAGGNHEADWPIRRVIATADRAVGQTVLADLYERMGLKGEATDLEGLFRDLGVRPATTGVILDDSAPLAAIRRAITA